LAQLRPTTRLRITNARDRLKGASESTVD